MFTYHCACYFAVSVFSSNIVFIFLSSIVNNNNNIRYQKLPKIKKRIHENLPRWNVRRVGRSTNRKHEKGTGRRCDLKSNGGLGETSGEEKKRKAKSASILGLGMF